MIGPQRHQLVWLSAAGWRQVHAAVWDDAAHACFAHWTAARLPLVTTRQRTPGQLALGLPAPLRFGRRRFAIEIDASPGAIECVGSFPFAADATDALAIASQAPWAALVAALRRLGCAARVYGSFGWQQLTHMAYLAAHSDIDLLLPVADADVADAVCAALAAASASSAFGAGPRIDGELLFGNGDAIAWREWQPWRSGRVDQVLIKRIDGVALRTAHAVEPDLA